MFNSQGFRLDEDKALRRVLYVTGFILILVSYEQVFIAVRPFGLGSLQWRLQAMNYLSANLNGPILGQLIILTVARFAGDKWMARAIGLLAALTALVLTVSLAVFTLDFVQYKAVVNTTEMERYIKAGISTGLTSLLFMCASLILAYTALRNWKAEQKSIVKGTPNQVDEKSRGMLFGSDMKSK